MTNALIPAVLPVEHWLDRAAPSAHPLIHNTHGKMHADPRVGMPRSESKALGDWGDSTQRAKEAAGVLWTWTDGTNVRVSTVSVYIHLLDLIVASNPKDGPRRRARTPSRPFQKGHHNARSRGEAAITS
jgi:hypothetical protein